MSNQAHGFLRAACIPKFHQLAILYSERESNPHTYRHRLLRSAWLPITTSEHYFNKFFVFSKQKTSVFRLRFLYNYYFNNYHNSIILLSPLFCNNRFKRRFKFIMLLQFFISIYINIFYQSFLFLNLFLIIIIFISTSQFCIISFIIFNFPNCII